MYATNAGAIERAVARFCGPASSAPPTSTPFNWALAELGRAVTGEQFSRRQSGSPPSRAAWRPGGSGGFDLLLTPTLPDPPPPLGYFDPDQGDPTGSAMTRAVRVLHARPST